MTDLKAKNWRRERGFNTVYSRRSLYKAFFDESPGKKNGPEIENLQKTCEG